MADSDRLPTRPFELSLLELGYVLGILSLRVGEPVADELIARMLEHAETYHQERTA